MSCCLYFFSIIRRSPLSTRTDTHLPYTTPFRSLILLHVSIVSADISSACQPEIAAYDGQQQRSGEHQHPSAPRRGGWSVCSGRALLNRGSRLLLPCGAIGFSHAAPPSCPRPCR